MKVIGFTGMPGSGKSEAMGRASKRGHPIIRMGDLIWDEVEARGLPKTSENVGPVANAMREEHGPAVWAQRTIARIRDGYADTKVVLIDGIRSMDEVDAFRAALADDFVLVAIHTDQRHRFERLTNRARADDPTESSGHAQRDSREMGWGIARAIALADEMIVNDETLEHLYAEVDELLDRVGA